MTERRVPGVPEAAPGYPGPGAIITTALAVLLIGGTAAAQSRPPGSTLQPQRTFRIVVPQPPAPSQHPAPPLSASEEERLTQARALRESGQFDAARDALAALNESRPHHPVLVTELARALQDKEAWRAIEQLGRAERGVRRDSLLVARELSLALEHLGRPKDALQIALEAWISSPTEVEWVSTTVTRLATSDSRTVREQVRKAAQARPERLDLWRVAARLEWRHGEEPATFQLLAAADRPHQFSSLRWTFAEDLLASASARDTSGALEVLLGLAADSQQDLGLRMPAALRAWQIFRKRSAETEGAPRLARALKEVPTERWGKDMVLSVIRGLRKAGHTDEARRLMAAQGDRGQSSPELTLENALTELRDGPPEKALPALAAIAPISSEGAFRYAEALFFAGLSDSALSWYQRVTADPRGSSTGAALERIYLLEDAAPRSALPLVGRLAYEEWRGEGKRALALADSLYRTVSRGPLWAHAALALGAQREAAGDAKGALEPLLTLAVELPNDRLAPLARQRAGDVYRLRLKDDAKALEQYEECLARYPKAWNAPEVRRVVEALRRDRRF